MLTMNNHPVTQPYPSCFSAVGHLVTQPLGIRLLSRTRPASQPCPSGISTAAERLRSRHREDFLALINQVWFFRFDFAGVIRSTVTQLVASLARRGLVLAVVSVLKDENEKQNRMASRI
jgi:hypothetical protein